MWPYMAKWTWRMWLRLWPWDGDVILDYPNASSLITWALYWLRLGSEGAVTMEEWQDKHILLASQMEGKGVSPEIWWKEFRRSRWTDCPLELLERNTDSTVDTLILAQWGLCGAANLQNCKKINLCCIKPTSLWWFVTKTVKNEYNFQCL